MDERYVCHWSVCGFFLTRSILTFLCALDMYNLPGVAETCDLEATRVSYYSSLFPLNPGGIVPVPPVLDLSAVPHRVSLGLPVPNAAE